MGTSFAPASRRAPRESDSLLAPDAESAALPIKVPWKREPSPDEPEDEAEEAAEDAGEHQPARLITKDAPLIRRVIEVRWKDVDRLEAILREDAVSRQSFAWRRASHFGIDRDTAFIFLAGREDVLTEATAAILKFGRPAANDQELWRIHNEDEDHAAESVGALVAQAERDAPPPPPPPEPANEWQRRWWTLRNGVIDGMGRISGWFWRLGLRMRRKKY